MIVTWVNFPAFVSRSVIDVKMAWTKASRLKSNLLTFNSITVYDKKKNKPRKLFRLARVSIASELRVREQSRREKTEKSHLVCGMKICIFSTFQYATTKNTNVVCRSTVAATKKNKNRVAINFNYWQIIAQLFRVFREYLDGRESDPIRSGDDVNWLIEFGGDRGQICNVNNK